MRSRRSGATCCSGSSGCRTMWTGSPSGSSWPSAFRQTKRAIQPRCLRRQSWRTASCCEDRSISSSATRAPTPCESPTTRPARIAMNRATVVHGGQVLQPVLYGLALEAITGDVVYKGRLWYCTTAGNFSRTPYRSVTHRAAPASRCSRSSIARSNAARSRRVRRATRAGGAISLPSVVVRKKPEPRARPAGEVAISRRCGGCPDARSNAPPAADRRRAGTSSLTTWATRLSSRPPPVPARRRSSSSASSG